MARFLRNSGGRSRLIAALVFLMLLPPMFDAAAATVEDLYSVRVSRSADLAPGQSPRTREAEIRFAMSRLLTRITGRLDAVLEPALADMLNEASRYLVQIGTIDDDTLLVTFDAPAVEAALTAREQPIWGSERPLTLLWIAIDTGLGERDILAAGESFSDESFEFSDLKTQFREEIFAVGNERGLPFALPLMDLEDMSAVSVVDIWAGFSAQLERASLRYGADAIVTGRARVTPFRTDIDWTLLRNGQAISLGTGSLRDGLDRLADRYASEFSTLGGVSSTMITVLGVETLEDYGRVMSFLESLSILDSIGTEIDFDGAALSLRANARGGPAVLERVLGLSAMLAPVPGPAGAAPGESRVTFNFVR